MPPHTPGWVSMLFALPVIALLLQAVFIQADLGEPYPALMMPGFEGTRTAADGVIRTSAIEVEVLFADGTRNERTTMAALLGRMPGSIVPVAAANVFRASPVQPQSPGSQESFKYRFRDALMPSRSARAARRAGGNVPSPELAEWTRRRVQALYPNRAPLAVVVHWIENRHRLRGRAVEPLSRAEVATYRVPLG